MTFFRRKASKYCPLKKLKCTFYLIIKIMALTHFDVMYGLSQSMPLVVRMTSFAFVKTV